MTHIFIKKLAKEIYDAEQGSRGTISENDLIITIEKHLLKYLDLPKDPKYEVGQYLRMEVGNGESIEVRIEQVIGPVQNKAMNEHRNIYKVMTFPDSNIVEVPKEMYTLEQNLFRQ